MLGINKVFGGWGVLIGWLLILVLFFTYGVVDIQIGSYLFVRWRCRCRCSAWKGWSKEGIGARAHGRNNTGQREYIRVGYDHYIPLVADLDQIPRKSQTANTKPCHGTVPYASQCLVMNSTSSLSHSVSRLASPSNP